MIQTSFNKFEKIPLAIFQDATEASVKTAREIAYLIRSKEKEGKKCVLGLATGSSPKGVYAELIRLHKEEALSFQNVVTFNLDEYHPMPPDALQSYHRFMHEYLFDHIDIRPGNVHIPDGTLPAEEVAQYCRDYDDKIEAMGGLDLQLLGIGRTGHIGFNEPGSSIDSPTRLITLDHITKMDAASDFFGEENVPVKAITMGVGTIMKAKRIIIMAWGEGKSMIIKRSVEGEVTTNVPATFLQHHSNTAFVIDKAASAKLTGSLEPWLFEPVVWDDRMMKKAVILLCEKVGKPILKLTDRDYIDHGLADLVHQHGKAYDINIHIFNKIQHTITGWPGGKPQADDTYRPERAEPAQKRVVIFSPHPDDDIISMGGTFIRLRDQGHDVHVAYQTSGNIAVFDEDVVDFAEFAKDYSLAFELGNKGKATRFYEDITKDLLHKKPGDIDTKEVRFIKGLIRKVEAKSTCRYVGIPDSSVHHLDLPFYETGLVKKSPPTAKDIRITTDLLQKIKPQQIFAAGDLSDPHGTHRVCLDIVFRAIEELKQEAWMKDCWIWLYRGAWQEWEIDQIEMAVPLSPDELLKKRRGIFKHQSQKDRPLFPGTDNREFWQRSEQRNRATAEEYHKLGLAEYEAIEAFKRYQF